VRIRPAAVGTAVGLGLLALALVLVWVVRGPISAGSPPAATIWTLSLACAPVAGWIIARRHPGHRYAVLLISFGLFTGALELTELLPVYATESLGEPGTAGELSLIVSTALWPVTFAHFPLLFLLFPDGHLPSARWRWLGWSIGLLTLLGAVLHAVLAAGAAGALVETAATVTVGGLAVAIVPAVASQFARRRSASAQERLQLRWFSWAAAFMATMLFAAIVIGVTTDTETTALVGVGFAGMYTAIGVSVTRYRLYEIERLISRTVSYAIVTAALVGLYLASVTVLTALTAPVTGDSPVAVAAATLLAAAAFRPLRRRVQGSVDRRFNRAAYDVSREVEAYRGRLRGQIDLESVGDDLQVTVGATLQPSAVVLWLHEGRHP
jgi:hypothetical protein